MNKVIRWQGIVLFIILFGGTALLIRTFAGPLLKSGLEFGLTRANGAEVNIERVVVQWSPFALRIEEIQFTDPEQPTLNRLQASSAGAELYFWDAVIGRIHITDLHLTGIAMGVARSSPGRVRADYQAEREPRDWQQTLADLNIDLPNTEELLQRSDIRTPAVVAAAEAQLNTQRQLVRTAREQLPDEESLQAYQDRIEEITEARPRTPQELLELRNRLRALRDEMRADRDAVRAFVAAAETASETLQAELNNVRTAPEQDVQRLRSLLAFDNDSLTELSGIFFGPKVEEWSRYLLLAFDFIGPMLTRSDDEEVGPSRWEGRYIDFDRQRRPRFLIDQALTDIQFASTHLGVEWRNITWQHDRIGGTPTTYTLAAANSPYWQELNLAGRFSLSTAAGFAGSQSWQVAGVNLAEQALFQQNEVAGKLLGAVLNSQGEIGVANGMLNGGGAVRLADVALQVQGDARWAQILADVLSNIRDIDMNVGVSGAMQAPGLSIRSDLDRQLQQGFSTALTAEADLHIARLRQQVEAEVASLTERLQPQLQQTNVWLQEGKQKQALFNDLFSVEPDDLQLGDQLRDRLRDSLRNRIGG